MLLFRQALDLFRRDIYVLAPASFFGWKLLIDPIYPAPMTPRRFPFTDKYTAPQHQKTYRASSCGTFRP